MFARLFCRASVLPILLAAPLAAQALQVPTYRIDGTLGQLQVEVTYWTPAAHLLLAAPNGKVVSIGGVEILADGLVLGLVPNVATATFVLPMTAKDAAAYGVHLQALVFDGNRIIGGPVVAAATAFDPTPFGPVSPTGRLKEVAMGVEPSDTLAGDWFVAEFTATSDGYALYPAAVVRHADVSDIYLTLKTPGPGEGYLDIVQYLRFDVGLGLKPGKLVRVFGREGPYPFGAALGGYLPCAMFETYVSVPK